MLLTPCDQHHEHSLAFYILVVTALFFRWYVSLYFRASHAIKKMYLHVPCQAMGVPRKNSIYWWYRDDTHAVHGMGNMMLDTLVDRFLINTMVGQVVAQYKYNPKNGIVTPNRVHVTPKAYHNKAMCMNTAAFVSKRTVSKTGYTSDKVSKLGDKIDMFGPELADQCTVTYVTTCEYSAVFNPRDPVYNASMHPQPQLHVGIGAIPQIIPATEFENFQTTMVYWLCEYEMDVSVDLHSYCTFGTVSNMPQKALYYYLHDPRYTTAETFAGVDQNLERSAKLTENESEPDIDKSTGQNLSDSVHINRLNFYKKSFDYDSPAFRKRQASKKRNDRQGSSHRASKRTQHRITEEDFEVVSSDSDIRNINKKFVNL